MAKARILSDFELNALREQYYYCPLTGIAYHRVDKRSGLNGNMLAAKAGSPVGYADVRPSGTYMSIRSKLGKVWVHRLAWIFVYGNITDPYMEIDHVNGNPSDNRISNLRLVSRRTNSHNTHGPRHNSASGYEGVYWYKAYSKWTAQIKVDGVNVFLGYFPADRIEDAVQARADAKRRLHVGTHVIGE